MGTTSEMHPHSSRLGDAPFVIATTASWCEHTTLYFWFSVGGGLRSSPFGAVIDATAINILCESSRGFVDSPPLAGPRTAVGSHNVSFTNNFRTVIPSSPAGRALPANNGSELHSICQQVTLCTLVTRPFRQAGKEPHHSDEECCEPRFRVPLTFHVTSSVTRLLEPQAHFSR